MLIAFIAAIFMTVNVVLRLHVQESKLDELYQTKKERERERERDKEREEWRKRLPPEGFIVVSLQPLHCQ